MFYNPYLPYFYTPFAGPLVVYRQPVPVYGYGPFGPYLIGYR